MKLMIEQVGVFAGVSHRYFEGNEDTGTYGILKFGEGMTSCVYFSTAAEIDAVIAELVALRNEMEPYAAVITDSERDCPETNPASGAHCHRGGDHGVHEDTDGEQWRTDVKPLRRIAGWCMAATSPRDGLTVHCELRAGHDGAHRSSGWGESEPDTVWNDEPAAAVSA